MTASTSFDADEVRRMMDASATPVAIGGGRLAFANGSVHLSDRALR
ncbi:hypothetical protein ACFC1I_05365 [Microbacterium sp. NPDC056044]